jgi:transcriptional regulator with XRE-family HTH domain
MEAMATAGISASPPPEFLAEFVKLQRGMRQWKQETLASFAGVSLTTIERIERAEIVSKDSLDCVGVALGYKVGDFTEPRVPLRQDEFAQKLEENLALFAGRVQVPVRPLRTQPQAAALARCQCYLVDGFQLGETCRDDIENLREWLGFTAFILGQEDGSSSNREQPVRRRELYANILKAARSIELQACAVALSGTYSAQTNLAFMPTVEVALIAFFPRSTDPGAVKRKVLFAPETIDLELR